MREALKPPQPLVRLERFFCDPPSVKRELLTRLREVLRTNESILGAEGIFQPTVIARLIRGQTGQTLRAKLEELPSEQILPEKSVAEEQEVRIEVSNDAITRVLVDIRGYLGRYAPEILEDVTNFQWRLAVRRWIRDELISSPDLERSIGNIFEHAASEGSEFFHKFLTLVRDEASMAEILRQMMLLKQEARKTRQSVSLNEQEIIRLLEFNYWFFIKATETAQSQGADFLEEMRQIIRAEGTAAEAMNGDGHGNGQGAAPELFPLVETFAELIAQYVKASPHERFAVLEEAFHYIAYEVLGGTMEYFPTRGVGEAFRGFVLKFWQLYPEAECIYDDRTYLPMIYSIPEGRSHQVDLLDPETEEEAEGESGLKFDSAHAAKRFIETGLNILLQSKIIRIREGEVTETSTQKKYPKTKQILCLFPSTLRALGIRFDIAIFMGEIEAANDQLEAVLGFRPFHVFVDSAQDLRKSPGAHIVAWSKRMAGASGGIAGLNREHYPEIDQLSTRSLGGDHGAFNAGNFTYSPRQLARMIATLFIMGKMPKKVGHLFANLLQPKYASEPEGNLFRFAGGGTFLVRQVKEAAEFFENLELDDDFEFLWPKDMLEPDPEEWRVAAILCIRKKSNDGITMLEIQRELAKTGWQMETFSLYAFSEIQSLIDEAFDSLENTDFNLGAFIGRVQQFQSWHASHLIRSLLPAKEHWNNVFYVIRYFLQSVEEHECARILFTADLDVNFLKIYFQNLQTAYGRVRHRKNQEKKTLTLRPQHSSPVEPTRSGPKLGLVLKAS